MQIVGCVLFYLDSSSIVLTISVASLVQTETISYLPYQANP